MDQLKNLANKFGSSSNKQAPPPADGGAAPAGGSNPAQKDDYLDKGFASASKKFGLNLSKENSEKITDGARGQFEKSTGKKVPEKFSN